MPKRSQTLYLWVVAGLVVGGALGALSPAAGVAAKPVADAFIGLIRMLIGPIVYCTVVEGIGGARSAERLGRTGLRTLVYFELVSTVALLLGLLVGNLARPGAGIHARVDALDPSAVQNYAHKAEDLSVVGYLGHLVPTTALDAFTAQGDLLQVLVIGVLTGMGCARAGTAAEPFMRFVHSAGRVLFATIGLIMLAAPLGAGAAMAYTIGKFGVASLSNLAGFVALFYATCAVFVLAVLGPIAYLAGFSILRYLHYVRAELLTVLGTSSSEAVLAPLMDKLERLGCPRPTVALVVPAGYSFNLDGTNIYMTLATLFVAQALGVELSLVQQLTILAVAMLTSKGAAGVTGSGFVTLAATLAAVPSVPVAGLALIFGIDRFMSEARAMTNFIVNGVATLAIAALEGNLDRALLARELDPGQDR
jgi:aerobic C4-dicarboxylate transport protein